MPEAYHPTYVEAAWQECLTLTLWPAWTSRADVAKALKAKPEEKFIMVIPPPNVTGSLHLGHALTAAIEDTITRWHRMQGHATLYLPGTDHAGIATQTVVEKKLKKDENLSRHDLGREEFVKRVWEWKSEYGGKITSQIRKLASSVDWSREAFTMDANLSVAVTEAFVRMHEDGLIFRDTRLVNWSCALKSAISDIEVDYIDLEGKTFIPVPGHTLQPKYEFGTLTHFAYQVEGSDEQLVVATTRLETMLGDTAVAVHPDDPRYTHLHGKKVVHPFVDRLIPIILDPVLVDMEFGTGAVKITPAHDPNDNECGKRHGLQFITILNLDGTLNEEAGQFKGMMRYDARVAVEKALDAKGLLKGKENNKMRLGLCSRSNDIIEPLLTPQWYVNVETMAAQAVAAVEKGDLVIEPKFHVATWNRWLGNPVPWCVSRQLWWGHRIPAYFVTLAEGEESLEPGDSANNNRWVVARSQEAALEKGAKLLGTTTDKIKTSQDPDVLDTWFSSGLFPFSVFGWPNETEDLKAFYPTTLLETGMDILFFWVARMVMMGLHLTGQLPFRTVYLHAMVRDKQGKKMSKSLGNVIDPNEVIKGCTLDNLHAKVDAGNLPEKEVKRAKKTFTDDFPAGIPECGADALRFGLLAYTVQGRDISLDVSRVVGYRNFCNKLWNATRFALLYVTDLKPTLQLEQDLAANKGLATRDKWVLSRLMNTCEAADAAMKSYEFGNLTQACMLSRSKLSLYMQSTPSLRILYHFWLNDLCDYYLELIKPIMNDKTEEGKPARQASTHLNSNILAYSSKHYLAQACLYLCLDWGLRLLHPMMPFVTEDLWQRLPGRGSMGAEEPESIMVAKYPLPVASLVDSECEAQFEAFKVALKGARSLRASYNIKPSVKVALYIKSSTAQSHEILKKFSSDISTLAKASSIEHLLEDSPPKGCGVNVLSDACSVFLNLKGVLDVADEMRKLTKQLTKLEPSMASLVKRMEAADYTTKVPEKVVKWLKNSLLLLILTHLHTWHGVTHAHTTGKA
ncbi:unnamed protein product [Chrysoparadoxa australica]